MTTKKIVKESKKPTKLHAVEVVEETPIVEEEVKAPEIVAPVVVEAPEIEQVSEPVVNTAQEKVDEVVPANGEEVVSTEKVPELDMAQPLPTLEEPKVDEVMTVARREWYVGIGVFVLFTAIVGGVIWGYTQLNQDSKPSAGQLEVIVSATPSPSPTVVEIKLIYAVWNGSGVAGAAGTISDKLKATGREVSETKNAPSQVTGSRVEVVPEMASQKALIETELVRAGVEVTTWESDLPTDLGYNVRVTIGK